jgi:hypothetical protein
MIERYATPAAWARWFERHEGVRISTETIRRRLKNTFGVDELVQNKVKADVEHFLYSETAIRRACFDLLKKLPVVDESGFLMLNGVRYGTINLLARVFGLGETAVKARLVGAKIDTVKGKSNLRRVFDYYPEPAVSELCADLLLPTLTSKGDVFFEKGGIQYGTIRALAQKLNLSEPTISSRVKNANLNAIQGKNGLGMPCSFYPEDGVRKLCMDLLAPMPTADETGFFEKNGVRYGTSWTLAKAMGLSQRTASSRLLKLGVEPILGKTISGQIFKFYSEPNARKAFEDALAPRPKADNKGFVVIGGIRYGTIIALARLFGLSQKAVATGLLQSNISSIQGRSNCNQNWKYYPEPAARGLLENLLVPIPKADKTGFVTVEGVRYGTIRVLSEKIHVSKEAIRNRIRKANLAPINGKDRSGRPKCFYSEFEVLSLCRDTMSVLPIAGQNGFVEIDGVRYGAAQWLAKIIGVSRPTIVARLLSSSLIPVKVRTQSGNICDFYPEPAVREVCADLLVSIFVADKDGFIKVNGVQHGTIKVLAKSMGIDERAAYSRFKESVIVSVRGKTTSGNIYNFYPEPTVRELCKDLIEKKKSNPKPR